MIFNTSSSQQYVKGEHILLKSYQHIQGITLNKICFIFNLGKIFSLQEGNLLETRGRIGALLARPSWLLPLFPSAILLDHLLLLSNLDQPSLSLFFRANRLRLYSVPEAAVL